MSNYHFKNKNLSLKAKGLLSLMLSLPEDWDYTIRGLASICKDGVDSISTATHEPQKTQQDKSVPATPIQVNPIQDFPVQAKHAQSNTNISNTKRSSTDTTYLQKTTTKEKKRLNAHVREEQNAEQIRIYRDLIERNIGYNALVAKYGSERMYEIMELIMEPFYSMSHDFRIGKKKYSKEAVRIKFLKLSSEQVEKVFEQIDHTTKRVKNPKSYVLTLLYNADIIDSFIAKREYNVAKYQSTH